MRLDGSKYIATGTGMAACLKRRNPENTGSIPATTDRLLPSFSRHILGMAIQNLPHTMKIQTALF